MGKKNGKKKGKKGRSKNDRVNAFAAHIEAWDGNPAGDEYLDRFCTTMCCPHYLRKKGAQKVVASARQIQDQPGGKDKLAQAERAYATIEARCENGCRFPDRRYKNFIFNDSQVMNALAVHQDGQIKTPG